MKPKWNVLLNNRNESKLHWQIYCPWAIIDSDLQLFIVWPDKTVELGTKMLILKISYDRHVYESVDDRSLF